MDKHLDLVIYDQLSRPLKKAVEVIESIIAQAESDSCSRLVEEGLYVRAFAQVECAIVDTLAYFARRNPFKLEFKDLTISRDKLLNYELTRELIDDYVNEQRRKWTFKSIRDQVRSLCKMLELDFDKLSDVMPEVEDISKVRNNILHYQPQDNDRNGRDVTIIVDFARDMSLLKSFVQGLFGEITRAYGDHGHVAALERLWCYLFQSPIMQFDDYWVTDKEKDRVVGSKTPNFIDSLCTSEKILLGIWRAEFNSDAELLSNFHMKSIVGDARRDLFTLLVALRDIWLY